MHSFLGISRSDRSLASNSYLNIVNISNCAVGVWFEKNLFSNVEITSSFLETTGAGIVVNSDGGSNRTTGCGDEEVALHIFYDFLVTPLMTTCRKVRII